MMAAEGQELSEVFGRNNEREEWFCPWPQKVVKEADRHPTESLAMTDKEA